jgi:hypothetical protein
VSDTPLVPAAVYGLRTWTVVAGAEGERLAGPQQGEPWPVDGQWLAARCDLGHAAPHPRCQCGIHGLHPRRSSAREVLAGRRQIPGVVEAEGVLEVHEDGFRAERARPYALVVAPGRNAALIGRLAATYRADLVEGGGPDSLLAWCRERGLGLDEPVVAELLGTKDGVERRRSRRTNARRNALRVAAAVVLAVVLLVLGLQLSGDPSGDRVLRGRGGEIHPR